MARVAIIGGGNSAHVLANIFPRMNVATTVITRRPSDWNRDGISLTYGNNPTTKKTYDSKPFTVTNDFSHAQDADIIFCCSPVSAESALLTELKPFVQPTALVGTVFGQARFDKRVQYILGDTQPCFAFIQIPWICRAPVYGSSVENYGNQHVDMAATNLNSSLEETLSWSNSIIHCDDTEATIQRVSFRSQTLFPSNMILHPGICYGRYLIDWKDPYFYRGLPSICGAAIEELDRERLNIVKALNENLRGQGEENDFIDEKSVIGLWNDLWSMPGTSMRECITADMNLMDIQVNPLIHEDGGHRFFQDDIPYGLCYMKLLADSVGVETPFVDRLIVWSEEVMKTRFLDDGKLVMENLPAYFRGDVSV